MTFMGQFKHKQKQSHKFWWSQPLPCSNSEAVYGLLGHNGPPSCEIGLKHSGSFDYQFPACDYVEVFE